MTITPMTFNDIRENMRTRIQQAQIVEPLDPMGLEDENYRNAFKVIISYADYYARKRQELNERRILDDETIDEFLSLRQQWPPNTFDFIVSISKHDVFNAISYMNNMLAVLRSNVVSTVNPRSIQEICEVIYVKNQLNKLYYDSTWIDDCLIDPISFTESNYDDMTIAILEINTVRHVLTHFDPTSMLINEFAKLHDDDDHLDSCMNPFDPNCCSPCCRPSPPDPYSDSDYEEPGFFVEPQALDPLNFKSLNSMFEKVVDQGFLPDKHERDKWRHVLGQFSQTMKTTLSATHVGMKKTTEVMSDLHNTVIIGVVVFTIGRFIYNPTKLTGATVLASLAYAAFVSPDLLTNFVTKCMDLLVDVLARVIGLFTGAAMKKKESKVELQAFEVKEADVMPFVEFGSSLFATVMGCKLPMKDWLSIIRLSNDIPGFIRKIITSTTAMLEKIFDQRFPVFADSGNPYHSQFEQKVVDLIRKKNDGTLDLTLDNLNLITELVDEGDSLYKTLPNAREFAEMKKILYDRTNEIRRIEVEFRQSNIKQTGFRQEPATLLLRGSAGTQKSTLLEHFTAAANAFSLDDHNYEQFLANPHVYTYNRQAETVFWDCYSNKTNVVLFDDFGQYTDMKGMTDGEIMNIIRICNAAEMDLHAAAIEKKGKLKMHTKFVLATTNTMIFRPASITCTEALMRRFQLQYCVIPKAEFCKDPSAHVYAREMDMSKLPKHNGESDPQPEHFMFQETDSDGEPLQKPPVEFDYVVEQLRRNYISRAKWQMRHKVNFKETAHRIRKEYLIAKAEIDPASVAELPSIEDQNVNENGYIQMLETQGMKQSILHSIMPDESEGSEASSVCFDYDTSDEQEIEDMIKEVLEEEEATEMDVLRIVKATFKKDYPDEKSLMRNWKMFETVYNKMQTNEETRFSVKQIALRFFRIPDLYMNAKYLSYLVWHMDPRKFIRMCKRKWEGEMDSFPYRVPQLDGPPDVEEGFLSKALTFAKEKIYPVLKKIKDFFCSPWFLGLAALGGVIFIFTSFFMQSEFTTPSPLTDTHLKLNLTDFGAPFESQMEYDHPTGKKSTKKQMTLKELKAARAEKQSLDPSGLEIIKSVFRKNIGRFGICDANGEFRLLGHVTFLKTDYAIVPKHYIDMIFELIDGKEVDESVCIKIFSANSEKLLAECTLDHLFDNIHDDGIEINHMCVLYVPTKERFQDITSKFLVPARLKKLGTNITVSTIVPSDLSNDKPSLSIHTCTASIRAIDFGEFQVKQAVHYFADTGKGDCGVPVFVRNPKNGCERIIGFHVAGQPKGGGCNAYAALIDQESILKLMTELEKDIEKDDLSEVEQVTEIEAQSLPTILTDNFTLVGKVKHKHSPYGTCKIVPSPLHKVNGFDQVPHMPVLNYPHIDPSLDPYFKNLEKMVDIETDYNPDVLERAYLDLEAHLDSFIDYKDPRILTMEEAIWGIESEYLDSIKASTSAGYPYKFTDRYIKTKLFGDNAIRDHRNPEYARIVKMHEKFLLCVKRNTRFLFVGTDNLKDEVRKPGKDSRLFTGVSMDHVILYRKYFGAFSSWWMSNSNDPRFESMCTMDPRSIQWDNLYRALGRFSVEPDFDAGAGDYKGYDFSQQAFILDFHLRYVNHWYNDEHDRKRAALHVELSRSRHLYRQYIFEWYGSLPSGYSCTSECNSFTNKLAFRYCFFYITQEPKDQFTDHVQLGVVGDDNIFSTSEKYKTVFNELALPPVMAHLGFKYTTDLKGEAIHPWRKISEVTFLKRSFRRDPIVPCMLSPLEYDSMVKMVIFVKSDAYDEEIFLGNLEKFCVELSQHPKEFFEEKREMLRLALLKYCPDLYSRVMIGGSRIQYLNKAGFYIPQFDL